MKENNVKQHAQMVKILQKKEFGNMYPKKMKRFELCCSQIKIKMDCESCGHKIERYYNRCRLNFCPHCGRIESLKRYNEAMAVLVHMKNKDDNLNIFFITFTIQTGDDLETQLKKIKKCMKEFRHPRRNPYWAEICVGGFQSIEVTKSKGKWHAHCHVILLSNSYSIDYTRHGPLKSVWERITGGSHVINVQTVEDVKGIKDVFKYTLKYDTSEMTTQDLFDFCKAMANCRTYTTFGDVYKKTKEEVKDIVATYRDEVSKAYNKQFGYKTVCPNCKEKADWEMSFNTIVPPETLALRNAGKNRPYNGKPKYNRYRTSDGKPLTRRETQLIEETILPREIAVEIELQKTLLERIENLS